MSIADLSAEDMARSLTGFDDVAVRQRFGAVPVKLHENDPTTAARALVFVHMRREGVGDAEAYTASMSLPMSDLFEYFADDELVLDGDAPETEQGKELPPSTTPTVISHPGAS